MTLVYYEPRCSKCLHPAEYNDPYLFCRVHWVDWILTIDTDDYTLEELQQERYDLLNDIFREYGPPLEYWYYRLIKEIELYLNEKNSTNNKSG